MKFGEFVCTEAIRSELLAADKQAVIHEMAQALLDAGQIAEKDHQPIVDAILEREARGSTGPGFFSVYMATANDKVDEARQGILDELEKLVDRAPSNEDLGRACRYLRGNLAIDAQRNNSHAAHIALDGLYGLGPEAHYRFAEQISAVTPQDVHRVARRILTLDAYTLSIVGDV